jgi:acetyl esterase/lipase
MRTKLTLFLLLFIQAFLYSQNGCDGVRYRSVVFNSVDTTFAIKFGENTTPGGANKELFMDIYEPAGDTLSNRPVIVYAFGGSFIGGNRAQLSQQCHQSAQRGFVAVAIDYRIYDGPSFPIPDSTVFADVAIKAMMDMKASVRKLREDAANGNPYRIDPNFIVAGGVSAGAITALHVGYVDSTDNIPGYFLTAINNNGGFEGNSSNNYQYSSEVQAVVNYSGALARSNWMDANDPPVFSVHDDGDQIVPYGQDYASISILGFFLDIIYVEGSSTITDVANQLGLTNGLITIPNSTNHVSYLNSTVWRDTVYDNTHLFLHNLICGVAASNESISNVETSVFPNPATDKLVLKLSELPSNYDVVLYDQLGQEVYRMNNISETTTVIERNNLAPGFYVLSMQFENKKYPSVQQKIIFR